MYFYPTGDNTLNDISNNFSITNLLSPLALIYLRFKDTIPVVKVLLLVIILYSISNPIYAQGVKGIVRNDKQEPIPFVNIFFKQLQTGTTTNYNGEYFFTANPGIYDVVFSAVGFEAKTIQITIGDAFIEENIWLNTSSTELEEIIIKSKRKDPAYEIIQNVIDNKKNNLGSVQSFKSTLYIKATETVDIKKKKSEKENVTIELAGLPEDPFEAERQKQLSTVQNLNMVEIQLELNYQFPDKYKEIRSGYKSYGNRAGLFIPHFSETDFNFYQNMVELKGIAEAPLISPLSRTSILSYKYKLDEILHENGQVVYKIEVIPRKSGNSTCEGYLYINEGLWNINRLHLELNKGGLKIYDAFELKLDYKPLEDSVWIPYRREFIYESRQNKSKTFKGNTVIHQTDYQKDYVFPPKFFGNEVSLTTKEAYKKDSIYWNNSRPEALTLQQQKVVLYRDSIETVINSKEYKDSIQAEYNRITLGEVLIHGVGFRNMEKKTDIYITSLSNLINFEVIGGFRFGPYFSFFKRWENGKMFRTSQSFNIGVKNTDLQGTIRSWLRYNPHKLADVYFSGGRSFYSVNSFDAYLNQLKISNYILHDHINVGHNFELFNGFYIHTGASLHNRQSLEDYDRTSIINEVIDEDDPLIFEDYQALITDIKFSYTPFQRYMTEPNQKVILGSKFPTFSILHRKGWNGLLSSDIDFDYFEAAMSQDIILGMLGSTKYAVKAGKFLNTKDLKYVDLKRFRQSDPYLYSNPLQSFQLLDTSLVATGFFLEAHHIHHFNGALINNIPLIKKLQLRAVAGAGALWIRQSSYRHEEIFAGVERVFKLGARRRLRLGVYGVLAESNHTGAQTGLKISFDIIDTWKKDWSY